MTALLTQREAAQALRLSERTLEDCECKVLALASFALPTAQSAIPNNALMRTSQPAS